MTFLEFVKTHPDFWKSAATMLDAVLTNGIDDTYTRAEREMIFAYASEDNDCNFCAVHHKDLSYSLGFDDSFTKENYINVDSAKLNNIKFITAAARFVNNIVEDFDITKVTEQNITLKDTPVKYKGYTI